MIYHKILFALFVAAVFLIAPQVNSAEIEGVYFEDSVNVDGTELTVRGAGLFRYLGFLKAYVGALYVEEGVPTDAVLEDTAKRLEIEYFYAIKGEDFGPATDKVIVKNTDLKTIERLRPKIDYHNSLYEDVQPGDRYSLTYIPGKGTELALNGNPIGSIEGADFASAIYAMWLGEDPMNKSFRKQLLGL
jgi:hypothetical protein